MSRQLKVRKIGNSLGVVFSKELLSELQVGEGDALYLVDTPTGMNLSPYDPDFGAAVEKARDVIRRYPNTMKKLAE